MSLGFNYANYEYQEEVDERSSLNLKNIQHLINKRNTIKHQNLNDTQWKYFKSNKSAVLIIKNTTKNTAIVKPPAQWLEPFSFKFKEELVNNEGNVKWPGMRYTTLRYFNNEIIADSEEPSATRTPIDTRTTITSEETTNKLLNSSREIFTCDRNLTRIAIFYSNKDELNCMETKTANVTKSSDVDLKCKDDLLETKFIKKLKHFYYVQLEPLLIARNKMNCIVNKRNKSFDSIYLKQLDMLFVNNSTNLTVMEKKQSKMTKIKYVYDTNQDQFIYLTCNLITKNNHVRKRLVWKLYLMTKNETCMPSFSFPLSPSPASLILIDDANENEAISTAKQKSTTSSNRFQIYKHGIEGGVNESVFTTPIPVSKVDQTPEFPSTDFNFDSNLEALAINESLAENQYDQAIEIENSSYYGIFI